MPVPIGAAHLKISATGWSCLKSMRAAVRSNSLSRAAISLCTKPSNVRDFKSRRSIWSRCERISSER